MLGPPRLKTRIGPGGAKGILFLLFFIPTTLLYGQKDEEKKPGPSGKENAGERVINAYFGQAVFKHPEKGPYLETYISIDGGSLHYKKGEDGKKRPKLQITVMVQKGDSVVDFDKTVTKGPPLKEDGKVRDMVDVKRFLLDSGIYRVRADLKDLNADSVRNFSIRSAVKVPDFKGDSLRFSDIQLIDRHEKSSKKDAYTKSGRRLIPYVVNLYPEQVDKLSFYAELYNSQERFPDTSNFVLRYYLYDRKRDRLLENYHGVSVRKPSKVTPLLRSWNIEELAAGNYDLVLEVRANGNQLMTRRSTLIQREGPEAAKKERLVGKPIENTFVRDMNSRDSLRMYLRAMRPIADRVEEGIITDQVDVMDLETLKRFFYGFWHERNKEEPAKEWYEYKQLVDLANRKYGTVNKKGYETERGRVMLQYGRPDRTVQRQNKAHSYPYEIWQYYKIGKYTNKRFVFYNTDLAGGEYKLLHSDMPGELKNRRWKRDLQDRQNIMDNVDEEGTRDHYGREVDDQFRNP